MTLQQRNVRLAARRLIRDRTQSGPACGFRTVTLTSGQDGDLLGKKRSTSMSEITTIEANVYVSQGPAESYQWIREASSRASIVLAWDLLPASLNLMCLDDLVGWATLLQGQLASKSDTTRTEFLVDMGNGWRRAKAIGSVFPDRRADVVTIEVTLEPPTPNNPPTPAP